MSAWLTSDIVVFSAIFLLVALAAKKIGSWFSLLGLPYITGYLLTGMIAGPFILDLLPSVAVTELRYIDELALGVIAFVAGSELYLVEIRARLRYYRHCNRQLAPFCTADYWLWPLCPDRLSCPLRGPGQWRSCGDCPPGRRHPAGAFARLDDCRHQGDRAKGPFTRTILGITVTMDVVIVVVFAIAVAIASGLLTGVGFSPQFALLLLIDLGLAVVVGLGAGWLLKQLFATTLNRFVQMVLMLGIGYAHLRVCLLAD